MRPGDVFLVLLWGKFHGICCNETEMCTSFKKKTSGMFKVGRSVL